MEDSVENQAEYEEQLKRKNLIENLRQIFFSLYLKLIYFFIFPYE